MTGHDPDSFVRAYGVEALLAFLGPPHPAPLSASLFPGWSRLRNGRLPNGADAAAYYAGDVPESPDTDALAAAWVARCDDLLLARYRRRTAAQREAAERDAVAWAEEERRRQAEAWARQLAAISTARHDRDTGDVIDRASRYLATCEGGESGSGRNPKAWGVVRRVTRSFALHESEALALLSREYAPRCRPALPMAELRGMVRRAMRATEPPWGCKLAE